MLSASAKQAQQRKPSLQRAGSVQRREGVIKTIGFCVHLFRAVHPIVRLRFAQLGSLFDNMYQLDGVTRCGKRIRCNHDCQQDCKTQFSNEISAGSQN